MICSGLFESVGSLEMGFFSWLFSMNSRKGQDNSPKYEMRLLPRVLLLLRKGRCYIFM